MWSPKSFRVSNIPIGVYVQGVTTEPIRYDINPEHQRQFVKTDKWCIDVIVHLYEFCTLTPLFYHRRKSDGVLENLDGKQRTTAMVRYMQSEFALPNTCGLPEEMCGYYRDLSDAVKNKFYNIDIGVYITDSELTRDEVSKFFERVQRSSSTTNGESMNADLDNKLRNMIFENYQDNQGFYEKYCTITMKRHNLLAIIAKCLYSLANGNFHRKPPSHVSIMKWGFSYNNTEQFERGIMIFAKLVKFMKESGIKQTDCNVRSMFMLASEIGVANMIRGINASFSEPGKCFDNYTSGVNSTLATYDRYMYLKKSISC